MTDQQTAQIASLYNTYDNIIKPLVSDIEARMEEFPTPVLNELRAFTDHIARCYRENVADDQIKIELNKAQGHIERIVLDCYKFLNVTSHIELIDKFHQKTKDINLLFINEGQFYIEYKAKHQKIVETLKEAKFLETRDKQKSVKLYEIVYNEYRELDKFMTKNEMSILNALRMHKKDKRKSLLYFLLGAIVSALISSKICTPIWDFFGSLIQKGISWFQ